MINSLMFSAANGDYMKKILLLANSEPFSSPSGFKEQSELRLKALTYLRSTGLTDSEAWAEVNAKYPHTPPSMSDEQRTQRTRDLNELIIDAGPSIITDLEKIVLSGGENVQWSRMALAQIGNDKSVDVIQLGYKPGSGGIRSMDDFQHETAICLARAARRNSDDVKFLLNFCSRPSGFNVYSEAALNLVAIRAKDAIPAFKSALKNDPMDIFYKDSLERITSDLAVVSVEELNNNGREVIAAIFSNGVPFFLNAQEVRDEKNNGIWRRNKNTWTFVSNATVETFYSIDFDVHISPDNKRAFADVTQKTMGNSKTNAHEFNYYYVLENTDSSWRIRWLQMKRRADLYFLPVQ